jgi:hypothetical protein
LLGILVGAALLVAADLYANRPRPSPELLERERREAFLKNWKPRFPVGTEAPEFSLKDRTGRRHSLSEFRGKPTLLCFYSDDKRSRTWAREMQKLRNYLGKSKMRSVAVVNFSPEAALAFQRETTDDSLYLFEDPHHHPVRDMYRAVPGPNAWALNPMGRVSHESAPIHSDKNPDQDFFRIYKALQGLTRPPLPGSAPPPRASGLPRPRANGG